ncbi:PCYCGC motif-containing (lipo)protein [Bacillus paramycoides]|uniref:PCYCGC motif-containing (lipo)protein n=1 Tax=Bacillus paramycoides TaxID=2026194 RepID=UPI002E1FF1BA|nr:PCYCGC motif-containing (lipo)protein [Bacillus paramycoides]
MNGVITPYVSLLIGCSSVKDSTPTKNNKTQNQLHETKNKGEHFKDDTLETTANVETLPSFLSSTKNGQASQIYRMIGKDIELLKWIPYYCGCDENSGHKSNKDCFIREIKENGQVTWNSHAKNHAECVDIAFQAVLMKQNGASPLEIREYFNKQYKKDGINVTPTPMPIS